MKVLVTGGAGYIGSVLIHSLLEQDYKVKCLDRFFFGDNLLKDFGSDPKLEIIRDDIRWFDQNILKDIDTVVNLAAISQPDPNKQLDQNLFYEINHKGATRLATLSKKLGVERYVFASTCSVYGFQKEILDENSTPKPIESYGKSKVLAEKDALTLADEKLAVTMLRFATAYGLSSKMRFDLVVNGMTLSLFKTGKIMVMRDGLQWRPVVHVKDITRAIIRVVESEKEKINGEIFNVGSHEQNYQIFPLAKLIGDSIEMPYNTEWYGEPDTRSYRVKFDKITKALGFKTEYTPVDGVREVYEALRAGKITDSPETNIIRWFKHLQDTDKLK